MFGLPASGKSTISNILVTNHNFKVASKDMHKNNFDKVLENLLCNNHNIVIDNTNLTVVVRKKLIELAKKYNYKTRCFIINCDKETCIHNSIYRALVTDRSVIPSIVFNKMMKELEYPTVSEGIDSCEEIEHTFKNTPEYLYYLK